jgi:molybdopterin converting factor subunit 1
VLFFAVYRELAGTHELEVELPDGSTVARLVALVRERPGAGTLPANPAVAVNQEYASHAALLHDGDEVALIPPVAGG